MSNVVENTGPVTEVVRLDTERNVVVEISNSNVINSPESPTITIETNSTETVVAGGVQGPVGAPGLQGDSFTSINLYAGTTLSGHRVVTVDNAGKLIYADCTIPTHVSKVLGIITTSAVFNDPVEVNITGVIEEPSWGWTLDDPIYLSTNGMLTQSVPTSGFSLIVAFPITSTKIFVDLVTPIILA